MKLNLQTMSPLKHGILGMKEYPLILMFMVIFISHCYFFLPIIVSQLTMYLCCIDLVFLFHIFTETYKDLFSIKFQYAGRFSVLPNKSYVDGEVAYVDMVGKPQFKIENLNTVLCSLGLKMMILLIYTI